MVGTGLRLGLQLPEVERIVPWAEHAAIARAAEDAGFDSLWVGDHLLYRGDGREERGPWDAWTILAALAATTTRVSLGPLVACTAFSSPGLLARRAAAVHEVSGGRLVLGLGAGWNEAEFRAFGLPFDRRAARFEESFHAVRRLLAGERVTAAGLDDAVVLPLPPTPIPLLVGSTGDRVLRATLPHVDGWNAWFEWFGNTPGGFAALNDRVTTLAAEAGRDPAQITRSATVMVAVDDGRVDRPHAAGVEPVPLASLPSRLREFAAAGLDEAILVVTPITVDAVRALAEVIP